MDLESIVEFWNNGLIDNLDMMIYSIKDTGQNVTEYLMNSDQVGKILNYFSENQLKWPLYFLNNLGTSILITNLLSRLSSQKSSLKTYFVNSLIFSFPDLDVLIHDLIPGLGIPEFEHRAVTHSLLSTIGASSLYSAKSIYHTVKSGLLTFKDYVNKNAKGFIKNKKDFQNNIKDSFKKFTRIFSLLFGHSMVDMYFESGYVKLLSPFSNREFGISNPGIFEKVIYPVGVWGLNLKNQINGSLKKAYSLVNGGYSNR